MKYPIILFSLAALLCPLVQDAAYAKPLAQSVHHVTIPAGAPHAPLHFGGWLVDAESTYHWTVLEPPLFGTLTASEAYVPGSDFDRVGADHFVIEIEYPSENGMVFEQHWIGISIARDVVVESLLEDFESVLQSEFPWSYVGNQSLLTITGKRPIGGAFSLRALPQEGMFGFLRHDRDISTDDTTVNLLGHTSLPEPPPPPFGGDLPPIGLMGLSNEGVPGPRIEVRATAGGAWQARATAEARGLGQPRLETPWVLVPHETRLELGLRVGPALNGRPGSGDYLVFMISEDGRRSQEYWLFGIREDSAVDLDIGILDTTQGAFGDIAFDDIRASWAESDTGGSLQDGLESGQWSGTWSEQPGPMWTAGSTSLSGYFHLEIDVPQAMTDDVWLVDPSPEQSADVTSSMVLDLDALNLQPKERLRLWALHDQDTPSGWLAVLDCRTFDDGYRLNLRTRDDLGKIRSTGWLPVAAGERRISIRWQAGDGNGSAALWLDAGEIGRVGGLENADGLVESIRVGAWAVSASASPSGTSKALRLDSLLSVY